MLNNDETVLTQEVGFTPSVPVCSEASGSELGAKSKNTEYQGEDINNYLVLEDGHLVPIRAHSMNEQHESFSASENISNGLENENENRSSTILNSQKRSLFSTLMSNKKPNLDNPQTESLNSSVNHGSNLELLEVADGTSTPSEKNHSLLFKKSRKITDYVDILKEKEEDKIDLALSKFIFGCNLPFRVVESPLFRNFIKTIRPAYVDKIPGRKKLSTTLLEKCYQECIDGARRRVNSDAVILCDGWKNSSSNTKTVVTMLHSTDGESGFIDAWDLTTESETAEKLAEIIMESTTIVKEKYNVDVYAVVSDNASAMVKMGSLIKHRMWHSTCNSHTGNLLVKDILDKKLVDNVVLVLKEFKQSDFEKMIVSKGGRRIKLPAETRWCSYRDSFKSLIENLPYIKQIPAATRKKIKPKVIELIFNDDFIDEVQKNVDIQNPICNLINTCQSAETSLADAVNLWLTLKVPEIFVEKLKNRQEMALNVYALTAYFLHPTYDNSKLTSAYTIKINAFLFKQLDNKGIEEWDKFNTRSGIFGILFGKKVNKPLVFWRMAQMECPVLGSLALKLLKIPASSAQLERLFSNWGYIHTPLRNRLSFEHSKMLVHLYFTLQSDNIEENLDPDSASSLTIDVED